MIPAPIVLFVYKRLDHCRKTVESLSRNPMAGESDLIIFSDGPKKEEDENRVAEVRKYLHGISGFKSVKVIASVSNQGLASSIIHGVTEVLETAETVIVMEDDLEASNQLLRFFNDALQRYREETDVACITGYQYPVRGNLPETFFVKGADCWSWATWRRGWQLFQEDGEKLLREIRRSGRMRDFNFNNTYPYGKMLKNQIAGLNDSWAIRWYASTFIANKLTLYPGRSLVRNIGMDASGTHCGTTVTHDVITRTEPILQWPQEIVEDRVAKAVMGRFFRETYGKPFPVRVWKKIFSIMDKER